MRCLITCEHAGNDVPPEYMAHFKGASDVLNSHRGYDIGAIQMAVAISQRVSAPLLSGQASRLLVDLNRSVTNWRVWSEFTRGLSRERKDWILEEWYYPFRREANAWMLEQFHKKERVLHLSAHTFTPVLHGKERTADIGLLYDPSRTREKEFCAAWKKRLGEAFPELRIRFNYPYQGVSDGFTTHIREIFQGDFYMGVELEVNQALAGKWRVGSKSHRLLVDSFAKALEEAAGLE